MKFVAVTWSLQELYQGAGVPGELFCLNTLVHTQEKTGECCACVYLTN